MPCGLRHLWGGCPTTMGLCCLIVLGLLSRCVLGYKQGDNVTLFVNKVGPYHNPQETYHFYTLPVCRPEKVSLNPVTMHVSWLSLHAVYMNEFCSMTGPFFKLMSANAWYCFCEFCLFLMNAPSLGASQISESGRSAGRWQNGWVLVSNPL